jgi:uncharacterized protein (DUF1800 family)
MFSLQPKTNALGYNNAYHLLRRCSYKITKGDINAYAQKTPQQAVADLFNFNGEPHPRPKNPSGQTYIKTFLNNTADTASRSNVDYNVSHWWFYNTLHEVSLQFRLQFLLHTFFPTSKNGGDYWNNLDYTELLAYYAKGSLKSLAVDITKNVKMAFYLDNRTNTVTNTNENYAREFLELFTILKGEQIATGNYTNYTEHDVKQAQRVFTGYTSELDIQHSRIQAFRVNSITNIPETILVVGNHDTGNKTFSAAFNNTTIIGGTTASEIDAELNSFVTMVFNQQETAKNYVRRFYRYFVGRELTPEVENDIITPLATTLQNNNYNIQPMLTELLVSKHFYDEDDTTIGDHRIGALAKSPLELATQTVTIFEVPLPNYDSQTASCIDFSRKIVDTCTAASLNIFSPESVNGYPGYSEVPYDKNFITANSLRTRYESIIDDLLSGFNLSGFNFYLDSANFVRTSGYFSAPQTAAVLLQDFFNLLLIKTPTGDRYNYFMDALLNEQTALNWYFVWQLYIITGNPSDARNYLNRLISALVKSPEYQIM